MLGTETVFDLLTSASHWGFEAISGLIMGLIVAPVVRWGIKRHDRKVHSSPAEATQRAWEPKREYRSSEPQVITLGAYGSKKGA